jgi:NDP-sugar pyrophosphorylase family protein
MVLAAGRGTRLASVGLSVPKPLVEIGGKPLLECQFEYLAREGIERVVVNAHHRADAIEAFVDQYRGALTVSVAREPKLLGTAGGVRNVLDLLGQEPFFVLYGDVIIDQSLAAVASAHRRAGAVATVTVYESDAVEGKGTVRVDENGWVTGFVEKREVVESPALINAGLYLLDPDFVADLPRDTEIDFGHDVFPAALSSGSRILAYQLAAPVIDVGTPEALTQARARAARFCS